MPRTCVACLSPRRVEIDRAIIEGQPFRRIASLCDVSEAAIRRHKPHVPVRLATAKAAAETVAADDLLAQVKALRSKSVSILLAAEQAGELRTALSGVRTALACLELLAELEQRIDRRPVVVLATSPEWLATRSTLIEALRPYPDARIAVAGALVALEGA